MTAVDVDNAAEAMRYCRDLTRRRARNFYYGLKLLPEPQRSALYAIYAWMRIADDLADGSGIEPEAAKRRIEEFRRVTEEALIGPATDGDPVLVGLQQTAAAFPIKAEHFYAMLAGQLDDLNGRRYETFEDLRRYCVRVASSVGLICIEIWGFEGDDTQGYAVDRGIALQLTNILRDYCEDYDVGRVYLPAEDFRRHELTPDELRRWSDPRKCEGFLLEQIDRAESYYVGSKPLDERIDRACVPTLWAMTEIYHRILHKMRADPSQVVLGPRIRLSAAHKGAIAIRSRFKGHGPRTSGR